MVIYPSIHTITLGDPDKPFSEGGRGPDEPTWYFDDPEQFEKALVELVGAGYDYDFTTETVAAIPGGYSADMASDFIAYLAMLEAP